MRGLYTLLVIIAVWASFTTSYADDLLFSSTQDGKKVEFNYDRANKVLQLELKRSGSSRSYISESFDISNPGEIDAHSARAISILREQGIEDATIESITNYFDEFKFVSTANCQAIHLGVELTSDTRAIEDLVSEFDRISAGIRGEGDFERSIELFEVKVPGVGSFQLRALVDNHGKPVKLSLSQDGGTLSDFKVERKDDVFTLSTADGKPLITIKNHGMKNEFVTLSAHGRDGLESLVRTHIRLSSSNDKLNAEVVATSVPTQTDRVGAVQLTTLSVEHRPVVRNAQMDIFIPSLNRESLVERVRETPFGVSAIAQDGFQENATKSYDACLGEAFVLRSELSLNESDNALINKCLGQVALEFADKSFANTPTQQTQFRTCLIDIGAIEQVGNGRSFSRTFFSNSAQAKTALQTCYNKLAQEDVRHEIEGYLASQSFDGDDSFAPLLEGVTQLALQAYRNCSVQNCKEVALARASSEMFKLRFLRWFDEASNGNSTVRDQIIGEYSRCVASRELADCQRDVMVKSVDKTPQNMYQQVAAQVGFIGVNASEEDLTQIKACITTKLDRVANGDFAAFDEWRFHCSFERFKENLSSLTVEHWRRKLSHYPSNSDYSSVAQAIELNLPNILTVDDAKKAVEEAAIPAHSAAVTGLLNQRLDQRLNPTNDREGYAVSAREEVLESLSAMTDPGSYNFLESSASYLRRARQARGNAGLQTAFRDLVMRVHTVPKQYELVAGLHSSIVRDDQLEAEVNSLNRSYEDCWRSFDANGSEDILSRAQTCDKKALANEQFSKVSAELKSMVSKRFSLATNEANEILAPLHYMDKCFSDGDPLLQSTYERYEKWVQACIDITRIDIASNMFEKLNAKYKPVLTQANQDELSSKLACFQNSLKEFGGPSTAKWFGQNFEAPSGVENARSVDSILQVSNQLSGAGSLLSSMFTQDNFDFTHREADRAVLHGFIESLIAADYNSEALMDRLFDCSKDYDSKLTTGFRSYLVSSVPNLYARLQPNLGESQQRVVEEVLDVEMAQLLLQVQAKNEYRTIESDAPGGTVVTSDFTVDAMARFIDGVGEYIAQGFVFDMDEMKTELVIFKEELKDALRYIVDSSEPVTLDELGRFFSESKLADHMALAHVAKNTNDNFHSFLSKMYDKDVAAFWDRVHASNTGFFSWIIGRDKNHLSSSQKRELEEIEAKYESLKTLSTTMTSNYDFRRIFNIYGDQGREAIELIKDQEFLPRIAGRAPSAVNKEQVDRAIAERILADNTAGGFTERFVREMAQEYLTKRSRSKWGITKWLFYDEGDFDWDVIRETASGRKAIEYYGKFVLLPRMLGQNLTRYEENLHKEKFEKLLREAQSEN